MDGTSMNTPHASTNRLSPRWKTDEELGSRLPEVINKASAVMLVSGGGGVQDQRHVSPNPV